MNGTDSNDFEGSLRGTVTFTNRNYEYVKIKSRQDSTPEKDESFLFQLTWATNGDISTKSGASFAASTIVNDDFAKPNSKPVAQYINDSKSMIAVEALEKFDKKILATDYFKDADVGDKLSLSAKIPYNISQYVKATPTSDGILISGQFPKESFLVKSFYEKITITATDGKISSYDAPTQTLVIYADLKSVSNSVSTSHFLKIDDGKNPDVSANDSHSEIQLNGLQTLVVNNSLDSHSEIQLNGLQTVVVNNSLV